MAMDKSAADAFVYAKASGMLARSFVGERAAKLFSVHSLAELWTLVFNTEVPAVPEVLLAKAIETEAQNQFLTQYASLIQKYAHPAEILIALLHFYDYDNLKEIGAALCFNEKEMPHIANTKPYNLIKYEKWPHIAAMTKDGALSWYNTVPAITEQQNNDYKLDCQYIDEVWKAAHKCSSNCRSAVLDLLGEHIRIENVLWALRLKLYYNMPASEIVEHLAYSSAERSLRDTLVSEAVHILDWELDDYEQWKKWKFSGLLNPHEEGVVWNVDPRWISNAYRTIYVRRAYKLFHQFPFTECPLVCWYIVKQHELDTIRTASECLRLQVGAAQGMQAAGITEARNG